MLAESFASSSTDDQRDALITPSSVTSWAQLAEAFAERLRVLNDLRGDRVGLVFAATPVGFATLAALERLRKDVFLIDGQVKSKALQTLSSYLRLEAVIAGDGRLDQRATGGSQSACAGSVTILTSGTSGQPKAARHRWQSLARPVRRTDRSQRWLMAYRPHLYAGLQVALQALLNRGTLIVPDVHSSPEDVVQLMGRSQCEYVSATPSYWRRLLLLVRPEQLSRIPLKQITLGGEVVDQPILDQLSALFPAARVVHIYATTEMGRCFSVTDGRAGFPIAFLERRSAEGIELKIEDQQLLVRSANAMSGYDALVEAAAISSLTADGWFPTGDLVDVHGQRVYFSGRTTDLINVGGNKVHPIEVEQVIRELTDVAEVRVFAQSSSLAGQLVACDVLPRSGADHESLRQAVIEYCNRRLNRYQRPRIVRIVSRLELSTAGKLRRAAE